MNRPSDSALARVHLWSLSILTLMIAAPLSRHLEPAITGYVSILIALRLAAVYWPRVTPHRWLLLLLTLAGTALVLMSYQTLAGRVAGVSLLTTMLALKLLELKQRRDLYVAVVLAFFLMVSQFLFDQSLGLAVYLLVLTLGLLALLMDVSRAYPAKRRLDLLRQALTISLQGLPVALVLFLLFPRLSGPLWDLGLGGQHGVSGIQDWLEPGSISGLIRSKAVAFRVSFQSEIPDDSELYWRGPVIWQTDGVRWTRAPRVENLDNAGIASAPAGNRYRYEVTLEPTGQHWLFALDRPIWIDQREKITRDFQVLARQRVHERRRFHAESVVGAQSGSLSELEKTLALQLPEEISPRMQQLVEAWRQGGRSPQDIVALALDHFYREPFHYTLNPPQLGADPVDGFLFDTRRGFCAHYATAFALLMRVAGIPSRIVVGYLGGEFNRMGDYLIVRQSDAHAWTEVWLSRQGWVRVDPTASIHPDRVELPDELEDLAGGTPLRFRLLEPGPLRELIHSLALLGDTVNASWNRWVLGFGKQRQQQFLTGVGLGSLEEFDLVLLMTGGCLAVLGLITGVVLVRWSRERDPVVRLYRLFCRRMAGIGLERNSWEGPRTFMERIGQQRPDLVAELAPIQQVYLELRYGFGSQTDFKVFRQRVRAFRPGRTDNKKF